MDAQDQTAQETDAVRLLTRQHREMESLLAQVAESDTDGRWPRFLLVADQLAAHIKSEEDVFYPAVHRARTEDDLLESLEEHLSLKRLLADLLELDPTEKTFEAKFKVLKEQTEHHHQEEEEHLFPVVCRMLDEAARRELGQDMLAYQARLASGGEARETVADETAAAAPLH